MAHYAQFKYECKIVMYFFGHEKFWYDEDASSFTLWSLTSSFFSLVPHTKGMWHFNNDSEVKDISGGQNNGFISGDVVLSRDFGDDDGCLSFGG